MPDTPDVSFTYDAVGNRTSMNDGAGSTSYAYDQLSRMSSETRTFTGLSCSYSLGYDYNLAGELKTLTYSNGATISYDTDSIGRTTTVTGSLYAGVTQDVTDIQYRAWGGPKNISYGNDTVLEVGYNSRLQLQRYNMKSYLYQGQRSDTKRVDFQYYANGQLRYAHDVTDDLKGKCKDLVEAMLKNVKGGVYTTNLLDLYKVLEDRHELYSHPGINAGGYGGGSVDDKTARLAINFQYGWSSPVWTAIEELTHANGPAGSKYISHDVMAQAAIDGARSLGISLDPLKNTGSKNSELGDPTTLKGDLRNSVLFRDVLGLRCH